MMVLRRGKGCRFVLACLMVCAAALGVPGAGAQKLDARVPQKAGRPVHPKLVVVIVVDQMRGDYVDKFLGQWSGGLKRMVEEGAWFRAAAYPYAATETCVGHATVSTGAFPASHGMVANAWWERDQQKMVTCTSDPAVKDSAYAGGSTTGGDSAVKMQMPAFAEELKFQAGGATRVVTLSLKARAAITLAGHSGDAVTWFDPSPASWVTSSAYGTMPFVEDFAKLHPVGEDFGKNWTLSLPREKYFYDEHATGAATVGNWSATFPHALQSADGHNEPDAAFVEEWQCSPFADTYLTRLAESAVDSLGLGESGGTDFLGISYSSVDVVGHAFGPRSWEIQDILVRLDKDLGELLTHLDQRVGRGNYVVALTADHGVAPIPVDMRKTGVDAGVLSLVDLQARMEKALEPFHLPKPAIAHIAGNEVYFLPGVYEQLKQDPVAMRAVTDAVLEMPGVAAIYRAEELRDGGTANFSQAKKAATWSYFPGRSGDLFVLQKPYWLLDGSAGAAARQTGTSHGTPYNYDQHVPILLMGYGIQPGEYFGAATPADIAPTLAALTGVTLASHDGRILSEGLRQSPRK